jgi:hypothetical protein
MGRTTRLAVLCSALLTLSIAGCGGSPTVEDPAPGQSSQSGPEEDRDTGQEQPQTPSTEDFTSPPEEETAATEEAEETGSGGVAIELAGLPIGGNAEVEGEDPTWRCAEVNWTGPPDSLPPEVNLEITAMGTNPPGAYAISDGACSGGQPPCLFSPGILNSPPCGVLIQQIAVSPDGVGELLVLSGDISCGPGQEALCEQFEADLAQNTDPARIEWFDALTEWPPTSDDSPNTG